MSTARRAERRTTLLALDGNSLAHRAYHAYSASRMTGPDGQPIWAVYGFLALLAGVCDKVKPDAIVVGFDGHDNVRKRRYPDYKATRSEKPEELVVQLDAIPRALEQLGVKVERPRGWEADDVVASWSVAAEAAGWQTIVATSDRDAFSLITDRCAVMRLKNGLDNAVFYTPARLFKEYGVTPAQYLDFAALRGDTSDNLPGATGIGEKTAAKLLAALGTVDAAYASPAAARKAIGESGFRKLEAGQDNYRRNVELMHQRRDLPVTLDGALLAGLDEQRLVQTLHELGLPSLVGRLSAQLTSGRTPVRSRTATRPRGQVIDGSGDDRGRQTSPPAPAVDAPPLPEAPTDDRGPSRSRVTVTLNPDGTDPRLAPGSAAHRRPDPWPLTV